MDRDFLLVQKMRMGDEKAIEIFVEKYYPRILSYCQVHIGDHGYAEDMTQETFERFFRSLKQYKHYGKAANYLYVIAANACNDYHRKHKEIVTAVYWMVMIIYSAAVLGYLGADGWNCPVQTEQGDWKCFYHLTVWQKYVLIFLPSFLGNLESAAVSKILGLLPDRLLQVGTALGYFDLYTLGGRVMGAVPILLVLYGIGAAAVLPVVYWCFVRS